eukprot:363896-Chlamydomonas_euryale.AAC.10
MWGRGVDREGGRSFLCTSAGRWAARRTVHPQRCWPASWVSPARHCARTHTPRHATQHDAVPLAPAAATGEVATTTKAGMKPNNRRETNEAKQQTRDECSQTTDARRMKPITYAR